MANRMGCSIIHPSRSFSLPLSVGFFVLCIHMLSASGEHFTGVCCKFFPQTKYSVINISRAYRRNVCLVPIYHPHMTNNYQLLFTLIIQMCSNPSYIITGNSISWGGGGWGVAVLLGCFILPHHSMFHHQFNNRDEMADESVMALK